MPILLKSESPIQKKAVPLTPLRQGVVFPHTETVLSFGRPRSKAGINAAFDTNSQVCVVTQKNPNIEDPEIAHLYKVGTLCSLERLLKTDSGEVNVLVKGTSRVIIENVTFTGEFYTVEITEIPEIEEKSDEMVALTKHLLSEFKRAVELGKSIEIFTFMKLISGVSPSELADQIANILEIKTFEKQEILEIADVKKRLEKVNEHLSHEIKILELERNIDTKTQKKFNKSMRETILRERMKAIKKELGEDKEERKEIAELREKIEKAGMPEVVLKKAKKELGRLASMHAYNPEGGYLRTYLDWLSEMPWSKSTPNNVSIKNAALVLNNDHYGLKEVKERILEYLAVMQLKEKINQQKKTQGAEETKKNGQSGPTILCFVGPPGVGKTSIGRSIAKSLGREFVRISLGGIRDEAEIRGHRRTYVGALPGRIIQGIKNAGTNNPVFMLDEIDKVGADFRGDPSAALLEALDPEQNREFSDHYLEVPFDLSRVMFITTANVLDTIPDALRDRLEVIRFPGYTEDEKYQIAKNFLIAKTLKANGLKDEQIAIPDRILRKVIAFYTREAGVRNLEREISKAMRKVAKKIAENGIKSEKIDAKKLLDYLGPAKFSHALIEKKDEVGMSTGLAWTQAGGDILFIEVALMPGKGRLLLTGKLGEVMQESCKAALSYIRSHWKKWKLTKGFDQNLDFHIHVPEGAVPKDGPSAGVAIAAALLSALTGKKLRKEVGMTGEITLRGRILEIGGVKEKIIAAHRAGLKKVILPKPNKKDLLEIPKKVKRDIKFQFVSDLDQVFQFAIK